MAEVEWIKIKANIFENEKILLIESLPKADEILIIWFKLLCLSGKVNNEGVLLVNNKIPYSCEMLSVVFKKDKEIISEALRIFEDYGMIETIDGVITIPNWQKHQNIESLDRIREQTRERVARFREKQRILINSNNNDLCNVTVTQGNGTEEEKEIRKDKENNKEKIEEVINLYHELCPSLPKVTKLTDKRIKLIKARLEENSIEEISEVFRKTEESDFLRNGKDSWNGANLEWILNPNNIVKILEGNYSNKAAEPNKTEKTKNEVSFIQNKEQEECIRGNFDMCRAFYPERLQDKGDYEAFLKAIESDNFYKSNQKAQMIKLRFMKFKPEDYDKPFREKIIS